MERLRKDPNEEFYSTTAEEIRYGLGLPHDASQSAVVAERARRFDMSFMSLMPEIASEASEGVQNA